MTILAVHLRGFIEYALVRGVPEREIQKVMKGPYHGTQGLDSKITCTDFYAVVELVAKSLGEDLLGWKIGNHLNLNTLGAIYKISLKASTTEEAIYYCHSYLQKTFPLLEVQVSTTSKRVCVDLVIGNNKDNLNRIILETTLTVMAREIHIISGEDVKVEVSSPYYHAAYPTDWVKSKSFGIKFNKTILKTAIKSDNTWGLDVLIPEYLTLVESMKSKRTFSYKVKMEVLSMAKPKLPDLNMVAAAFNLNPRTFQRRLIVEATSFRKISDELKKDIAILLMQHKRFSVADIAAILGYSESAAFIHSFRKWYGKPPRKVREEQEVG